MEQSPISGYTKAAAFGALAFMIFLSIWQGGKTEEKIVRLEQQTAATNDNIKSLSDELRQSQREVAKLRGVNETLLKIIARGGISVRQGGGGDQPGDDSGGLDIGIAGGSNWDWNANANYDRNLDPGRPTGTPGRYKNFLRKDPDHPIPETAPNYDGEIRMAWGSEPKGFNFMLENYSTLTTECEAYVADSFTSRHWKDPSTFNRAPAMAWRVEINPDFTEYTIFLRKDVYWQPPPPAVSPDKYPALRGKHQFTAHDAAFTLQLIKDQNTKLAVIRAYYDELKDWEVIDDFTFVVRWKKTQHTSIAYTLAMQLVPKFVYGYDKDGDPYSNHIVGLEFNEHWFDNLREGVIGTGPYRFMKYEKGKYIRLERWNVWYGFKDEPLYPIRTRHLKLYEESDTQLNWVRKGETDIGGLNAAMYRNWVLEETDESSPFKNGDIRVVKVRRPMYLYFGWKNTDPMFTDKRVRKALTYACNRQDICKKIFLDRYEPMSAPLYPASVESDPTLQPYPFDLDKANRMLDEAGWLMNQNTGLREKVIKGETIVFDFKLYWPGPNPEFQSALDHFKNDLLKCGIRMTPQSVKWAQFQKDLTDRKYSAFSLLWVLNGWEHDFGQIWHSDGIEDPGSSNYIEFKNEELDRLSDELRATMDPQKRIAKVRRIGRILYEEQPYTFFGWSSAFRCFRKHVKNTDKVFFIRPFLRTTPFWIER